MTQLHWLVVSAILKNFSHWEGLSHIIRKIKNVPNHQSVHVIGFHGLYANSKPQLPKGVNIQELICCSPVTPLFLPAIVAGYPRKNKNINMLFWLNCFFGKLYQWCVFLKKWYGLVWYTIYTYLLERFKERTGSPDNGFTNAIIEKHIQQIQIYHKLRISYGH